MKNLVYFFLIMVGVRLTASEKPQVPLSTQVLVCEGDKIPLMTTVENVENIISDSKIHKNGEGFQNLMIKTVNKKPWLAPRVDYINPTSIYIKEATINDTGPYEINVTFMDDRVAWHRFNVSVFTECPDKRQFYAPDIKYKIDKGTLSSLPKSRTIQLGAQTMLTLNCTIPKANLPATCMIKGKGRIITTEGAGNDAVYCLATFHNDNPENYTITVNLEHLYLQSPSKTDITIIVSKTKEGDDGLSTGAVVDIVVSVIVIIIMIIGIILGYICWKKKKFVCGKTGSKDSVMKGENESNKLKVEATVIRQVRDDDEAVPLRVQPSDGGHTIAE